jgi:hypothetical protein
VRRIPVYGADAVPAAAAIDENEAAIDAQDFENAAVLRERETQMLDDKAARQQEWATLLSLSDEVERLCRTARHNRKIDCNASRYTNSIQLRLGIDHGTGTSLGLKPFGPAHNAMLGWWWADPAAGYMLVYYAAREVREIFTGNH